VPVLTDQGSRCSASRISRFWMRLDKASKRDGAYRLFSI
jgi:hypothetical protein